MKPDRPILMARIGGAHGVKGEVRVKAFGDAPLTLGGYGVLYSQDGREFEIDRLRPSGNVLVVKFNGVNQREDALALNGVELFVDRSVLPNDLEEDEFYVSDLIGCKALDPDRRELGVVKAVHNFGAGDLIEIVLQGVGESIMVEFSRKNVPEIFVDEGRIILRLPDEVSEREV